MSIHLNVTGDTADEFLAQFTALAHALGGVSTGAVAATLVDAGQPVEAPQAAAEGEPVKPVRSRTVKPKDVPAASEPAGSVETHASGPVDAKQETSTSPTDTEGGQTSPEGSPALRAETDGVVEVAAAPAVKPLVFDTDVAPKVVEYVQLLGRDAVAGVLSQFGVQKASQLSDPAQWQELLDALADAKA